LSRGLLAFLIICFSGYGVALFVGEFDLMRADGGTYAGERWFAIAFYLTASILLLFMHRDPPYWHALYALLLAMFAMFAIERTGPDRWIYLALSWCQQALIFAQIMALRRSYGSEIERDLLTWSAVVIGSEVFFVMPVTQYLLGLDAETLPADGLAMGLSDLFGSPYVAYAQGLIGVLGVAWTLHSAERRLAWTPGRP
jgi:hypothetical protein